MIKKALLITIGTTIGMIALVVYSTESIYHQSITKPNPLAIDGQNEDNKSGKLTITEPNPVDDIITIAVRLRDEVNALPDLSWGQAMQDMNRNAIEASGTLTHGAGAYWDNLTWLVTKIKGIWTPGVGMPINEPLWNAQADMTVLTGCLRIYGFSSESLQTAFSGGNKVLFNRALYQIINDLKSIRNRLERPS
jgi:hypothetical protein